MDSLIFGITGWKNSGKTTLLTKLVTELTKRGLRVATIKHAHHTFDIDHPGRDSYRHRESGAVEVALVSNRRWVLMHELKDEDEPSMQEVLARMSHCDIVLIEGYKREDHPKIEVRRSGTMDKSPMSESDSSILAIASDFEIKDSILPVYSLDDTVGLTDFILNQRNQELQIDQKNSINQ